MKTITYFLKTEAETALLGEFLAPILQPGTLIFLTGELGAGKTAWVRGLLNAIGYQGVVKSPTYALVESYDALTIPIYHFDLYRLGDPEELEYMGLRDYLSDRHICIFEWPEKGRGYLPKADIQLNFSIKSVGREVEITLPTLQAIALQVKADKVFLNEKN